MANHQPLHNPTQVLKVPHVIAGISPLKRLESWLHGPCARPALRAGLILDDLEVSGSTRAWADLITQLRQLLGAFLPHLTLIAVARQDIFADSEPPGGVVV